MPLRGIGFRSAREVSHVGPPAHMIVSGPFRTVRLRFGWVSIAHHCAATVYRSMPTLEPFLG